MSQPAGDGLEEQIVRMRTETMTYQRTWWRADQRAQQRCDDHPVLEIELGDRELVDTKHVHHDRNADVWFDDRQALHASLVRE